MFLNEVFNDTIVEEIYEDSDGDPAMSCLEMELSVNTFNQKLKAEKNSSWISQIRRKKSGPFGEKAKYFLNENNLFKSSV